MADEPPCIVLLNRETAQSGMRGQLPVMQPPQRHLTRVFAAGLMNIFMSDLRRLFSMPSGEAKVRRAAQAGAMSRHLP